jgi:hypothetical protein
LSKLEEEESKLKQEGLEKQNVENQRQELLMQMEEQKKCINLKCQYDTNIQN